MDEPEIIEKLKAGDDEAFRIIVEKYQGLVLNCSFKFLRSKEAAEDITQEVFLEVFESIHSFRGESSLSTWIYRIAVTKSLNYLKSLKRKKRFATLVGLFNGKDGDALLATPESMSPSSEVENQDRARMLSWALEKLSDNQRVAFTLSKYKELSYEEISAVMNLSIPSVESLIHRAKMNLRKLLTLYYQKHL
jgi:RNA polymerase sigma-70 factor, ECF subfamily